MNETAALTQSFRPSPIWIVPVVALVIGGWMVLHAFMTQGPTVEVKFATAEGLKAGETRVKRLSVDLGVVESVYLNDGFGDVTAVLKLDHGTESLLREDTQFWVVRPRLGSSGVSGLSTLLSGAYVELSPGHQTPGRRRYTGLEDIPVTPQSAPGLHLELTAERAASLSVGSPVLYNGYRVGRVETAELSAQDGDAKYRIFVDAPYDDLITSNTRFWNASGLSLDAGAEGVSLHMESLEALMAGGVAFGLPTESTPGQAVRSDQRFRLYRNYAAINEHPYRYGREYLLLFDTSVRGLMPGAPVDYRGIRLGTVVDVSFDLVDDSDAWTADGHALMPVLVRIDPGRLGNDDETSLQDVDSLIANGVRNGLRASLASGNMLTGSRYVSLDFYEHAQPQRLTEAGQHTVLPTMASGFDNLANQVSQLLDKVQSLPLDDTVVSATHALDAFAAVAGEAEGTLVDINELLEDPNTRALPQDIHLALTRINEVMAGFTPASPVYTELQTALMELRKTLRNAGGVTKTLEAQPSALLFGPRRGPDPIPEIHK